MPPRGDAVAVVVAVVVVVVALAVSSSLLVEADTSAAAFVTFRSSPTVGYGRGHRYGGRKQDAAVFSATTAMTRLASKVTEEAEEGTTDVGGGGGGGGAVKEDINPLTRASWYAVEAFGKVFGGGDDEKRTGNAISDEGNADVDLTRPPRSLDEALTRIKLDNDRSYFLSGNVDSFAYDPCCTFSDPFVSFEGRDRFVDNLANLGSFITEYDAKMLDYEVSEGGRKVQTRVMVKLELNLPWKPVLAWPWGVTYDIDPETFLITSHGESWDIEPWEGVKQIFRKPTLRISKK